MQELEKILEEIEKAKNEYPYTCFSWYLKGLSKAEDIVRKHLSRENDPEITRYSRDGDGWIPVEKELPKENTCIDKETGYYGRSDDVLCSAYDDYTGEYEIWIDYTIDGEWQTHDWYEGDPLAWQPLPDPYRPERSDNHDRDIL